MFRQGTLYSIVMGPAAHAIGAGLAWLNVIAAFVCYACIALYLVCPHAVRGARRS